MRLSASQVKTQRELMAEQQGHLCLLCCDHFSASDPPVLDHCHKTGHVRGVLHRGCNAMLGHIENNTARNNLHGGRLFNMLERVRAYVTAVYTHNPLHPTYRTEDEKRLRRNKRAKVARAKKKDTS